LVINLASTTHSQLSAEEPLIAGATLRYVWLIVSIELIEDIIAYIEQDRAASWQTASVSSIPQ